MNTDIYPPINFSWRPLKYTPEQLLEKFQEYVQWAIDHPIETGGKTVVSGGGSDKQWTNETVKEEKTPRLVSIEGFLVHIGSGPSYWSQLDKSKRGDDFLKVKSFIREYCAQYQKEMASAGIFNANIISRLLGLADKVQHSGEMTVRPIVLENEEQKKGLKELDNLDI